LIQPDSPLLTMTSDISTVHHIESAVRKRTNCARDSQEHYPESIIGCPVAWQMEILERLRALDVCDFHWFTMPTPSKRPQRDLGPGGILEASPIEQHVQKSVDAELLTPAPAVRSVPISLSPPHTPYSSSAHLRQRQRYPNAMENPTNLAPWRQQSAHPQMNEPCTV